MDIEVYKASLKSPQLCSDYNSTREIVLDLLGIWLTKAKANGYFKELDTKQISILLGEFWKIFTNYKWMRVDDVSNIMDRGLSGMYGKIYNLNQQEVNRWCVEYEVERRKTAVLENQNTKKYKETEPSEMTEQQKQHAHNELKRKLINGWKEWKGSRIFNSDIVHGAPVYYKWFDRSGLIKMSTSEKWDLYDKCLDQIKKEDRVNWKRGHDAEQRAKDRARTISFENAFKNVTLEDLEKL